MKRQSSLALKTSDSELSGTHVRKNFEGCEGKLGKREGGGKLTRKVPRLAFVKVDFRNGMNGKAAVDHLLGEVVADQLLVRGVEPEAWRQEWLRLLVLILPLRRLKTCSCHG